MSEDLSGWDYKVTKGNVVELRKSFSATGSRFAQVLIKISIDGVKPTYKSALPDVQTDPNVVMSMNGTAGLSLTDWGNMHAAINEGIARAVRLNVSAILGE